MKCSKTIVGLVAVLLSFASYGEVVVLHAGRVEGDSTNGVRAINVVTRNPIRDYYEEQVGYNLARYGRWSIADLDSEISVRITSTVEQAKADLGVAVNNAYPSMIAEPTNEELDEIKTRTADKITMRDIRQGLRELKGSINTNLSAWSEIERLTNGVTDLQVRRTINDLRSVQGDTIRDLRRLRRYLIRALREQDDE